MPTGRASESRSQDPRLQGLWVLGDARGLPRDGQICSSCVRAVPLLRQLPVQGHSDRTFIQAFGRCPT